MKVLLIADIGGFPKGYPNLHYPAGFIHAGDEAIFKAACLWYKERKPHYKLSALTWGRRYPQSNITARSHFTWPTQRFINRLYFIKLAIKLSLCKTLKLNIFTANEYSFLEFLLSHDRIHFIGGGNINSMFPAWLYYCYFILFVAYVYNKEVVLTGQTIGPFKRLDYFFGLFFITKASIVGLRELTKPVGNVKNMLDIAYNGLPRGHAAKKNSPKKLVIGLSLHEWRDFTHEKIVSYAIKLIKTISVRYNCQFVFIPHIISRNLTCGDIRIYRDLKKYLGSLIILAKIPKKKDFVEAVRGVTRSVDFVISSRYHGLVFALSQNVPALNVILDNYYDKKNTALIKIIYGIRANNYSIDLRSGITYEETIPKITNLIENIGLEQNRLVRINRHLRRDSRLSSLDNLLQNELILKKRENFFIFSRLFKFRENTT